MDITTNLTDSETPEPSRRSQGPKRIYRDPDGPIAGVAGGFAVYLNIDPVIARLLWIVALVTGVGIPAYIVCWVMIPRARAGSTTGHKLPAPTSAVPGQG